MFGIPNMKLDKKIVARRIKLMTDEGVVFKTGIDIGKDISYDKLKHDFDAVVLCSGSKKARDLVADGRDAKGIYFAVDFLTAATKKVIGEDKKYSIDANGKNVVIVGGGDTGNDCVGTCIRQGCKSVIQLEMMPPLPDERAENNPWPQWPRVLKTDYGQQEAIAVFGSDPRVYCTTVKEFIKNNKGILKKVKTESPKLYVKKYDKLKKFIKEQEKCPDILQHEEIEEIYKNLLPGTQLNDKEKQEHIERIKKQYKKN